MAQNDSKKLLSFGITACIGKALFGEAVGIAKKVHKKGVSCFLIDWERGCGESVLKELASSCSGALVGAARVENCQEAKAAVAAGAELLSTNHPYEDLILYAKESAIPLIADCENEDDIRLSVRGGASIVRPRSYVAWEKLRCQQEYNEIQWVVSSTESGEERAKLFKDNSVLSVCTNLEIEKKDLICEKLEALLREMLNFSFHHLGINGTSSQEAQATANTFETVFGFKGKDIGNSIFCGPSIEALKAPFVGTHGHICIGTANVSRAVRYLSQMGFTTIAGSEKYADGTLIVIYLKEEVAGFGFHLLLKG